MTPTADEMLQFLDSHVPEGDFTISELVDKAVATLQEKRPELLHRWMMEKAHSLLRQYYAGVLASRRNATRKQRTRDEFGDLVDRHADGAFATVFVVDDEYRRRHVRDMTADDHRYVADFYSEKKDKYGMLEAFHREIASRIPDGKTTADVLSEEQYEELYQSLIS